MLDKMRKRLEDLEELEDLEDQCAREAVRKRIKWIKWGMIATLSLIAVVAVIVVTIVLKTRTKAQEPEVEAEVEEPPKIVTVATLEKIIDVSELSTFTSVYNGITQMMNEKKPEDVDYYVSYEATVKAGIDFSQVDIDVDDEAQAVRVTLPQAHITEMNVDVESLDFMIYNKSKELGVTQRALKLCEDDLKNATAEQTAILDMAQQNAVNVVRALTEPFLDQFGYTLTVE